MVTDLNNNDVFLRSRKILARMLKIKEEVIKPSSLLRSDLGVDSLDIWEIVSKIEEEFSIEVSEDDVLQVNAVKDVVQMIEDKMKIPKD